MTESALAKPRIALLFSDGNFVGREYHAALVCAGWVPDLLIAVGSMSAESQAIEIERTAGRWNPPDIPAATAVHRFERLDDPSLVSLILDAGIDVAIQGGVGILREPLISAPRFGVVNVHPGRLPAYRGSACPEWAVLEGAEVIATAHVIDGGVDTGPVLLARPMEIDEGWDYYDFRANLYAH
jgi:methionyl-tRNA formyltransferase